MTWALLGHSKGQSVGSWYSRWDCPAQLFQSECGMPQSGTSSPSAVELLAMTVHVRGRPPRLLVIASDALASRGNPLYVAQPLRLPRRPADAGLLAMTGLPFP
ncbi:MAG: hypothetical protein WAO19_03065 [Candidatus Kryptoniota bacterium]